MTTVANSSVLITGASRGIGQALVEEALRRGAIRVYAGMRVPVAHPDERVTPLALDITDPDQIQRAADAVDSLDVLVNNAGVAIYDDLSSPSVIQQHLDVNLFGPLNVARAFLPQLTRSRGAVVNNLSLNGIAAFPLVPGYSVSKAAAFSMTQSLRSLYADHGVSVHAVLTGPTDTDMNRAIDIPKATTASVAQAIFDGMENGEDDIFPDPMSASMADGWRSGLANTTATQFAAMARELRAAMSEQSYSVTYLVDQTPEEVFAAVTDVRGWWSREIEGPTDVAGAEFRYRYRDVHRCTMRITEFVPHEKVVWHCLENHFDFTRDDTEWVGTDVVFEISREGDQTRLRFTHLGLVPSYECYDVCTNAWGGYITDSLKSRITTGTGKPNNDERNAQALARRA